MRWLAVAMMTAMGSLLRSQPPEITLPRPGLVQVTEVAGEVSAGVNEQRKAVKPDERIRVGSTIATGRKSLATLVLSNASILRIGSDAELEIEEFGQAPISGSLKFSELKEEPTISRTRIRLVRGGVTVEVKPLKAARGSTFHFSLPAGTLRTVDATFQAMVQMSDLGLGVCTLELEKGKAEFELAGAAYAPLPLGSKLAFALELDRASGVMKVGEMPKPAPKAAP